MKKLLVILGICVLSLYILFLIIPFFLTGYVNSYDIPKIVEDACGYKVKVENVRIVTTPKLTMGLKVGHVEAALPTGEMFLTADNAQVKMSLIPLVAKNIELDQIGADNINLNLKIKKDGHFLLEDYISQNTADSKNIEVAQPASLPFGFKLSNHLPNIVVNNYNISFIDVPTDKSYSLYGEKFVISDFILNKRIKLSAIGKFQLEDREQFNYDIRILNKVMPDITLEELVFSPQQEAKEKTQQAVNIIDILKAIYINQLNADLKTDITVDGTIEDMNFNGYANIANFTVAVDGKKLPVGNIDLKLKGNKIKLYSKLYTAEKEITELVGDFKTGKHPNIELNCKSNAQFKSIIDMIDSVAQSFGYTQLNSLSATGGVDADFTVKSNLKSIESSGYLKIPSASLSYKLYNIVIDKIFADIQFANNSVDIKDSGLTILGQPLKIKGTISSDARADINIFADRLQIKGLLLAAGQMSLLKENQVNSGTITMDALLKGQFDKIVPKINLSIDNVNIKNIPSNTMLAVQKSIVNLSTDGKLTSGKIDVNSIKIINPMANLLIPKSQILLGQNDIDINNTYLLLNNSRIDIIGKVTDYMSNNINFNINARGNLLASDIKMMFPKEFYSEVSAKGALPLYVNISGNDKSQDINFKVSSNSGNYLSILNVEQLKGKTTEIKGIAKLKGDTLKFADTGIYANGTGIAYLKGGINDLYKSQSLNLNISTPSNVSMSIPFIKNSKMNVGGNINILGEAINPILEGNVVIPLISMPDMLLTMTDMALTLNGPIAKGKGTLKKFVCGGIVGENLSSDFNLTNNIFYLKNLLGDAFSGKINGNISYNLVNGNVGVDLKGTGMDAEKAIAGAVGLKNALSGKLNFTANVTTKGDTDIQMMKNLRGKASFDISDGEFGNIGRFDNFILAQNLMTNPIIKAGINSIRALPVVKNTAEFKTIFGTLTFSDGWANLTPVKTSGPSMAYYITGKYNLLNATANVVILGRISADVVKLLGPLGELSLSRLTSLIPGIGNSTIALVRAITTNPYGEKISEIPSLSSGNTNYKDFKVQFNGGVESSSSVKTFKWLSVCDTSEIESFNIKEQVKATKQAVQEAKQQQIDNVNKILEEKRKQAQEDSQQMKDAVDGLKNLFKQKTSQPIEQPTETVENTTEIAQ